MEGPCHWSTSSLTATFEWQGTTLIRHCSLVRRALVYWTYVAADVLFDHTYDAFQYVMCYLNNMAPATEY
eukprot:12894380-Prorocentrum_lima.AAC.1